MMYRKNDGIDAAPDVGIADPAVLQNLVHGGTTISINIEHHAHQIIAIRTDPLPPFSTILEFACSVNQSINLFELVKHIYDYIKSSSQ